jgi:hypothetical protein
MMYERYLRMERDYEEQRTARFCQGRRMRRERMQRSHIHGLEAFD